MKIKYVYIAAPMTGPPNEYLANCVRLSRVARELVEQGFCVINPAGDMLEGLMSERPLPDSTFKARSMDLLRLFAGRDDSCVFVLETMHRNGTISGGVGAEVEESERLEIPVVYSWERFWHLARS